MSKRAKHTECAACGATYEGEGEYSIHRDGFGEGPEVPLCIPCGSESTPTCEDIWDSIARRRRDAERERLRIAAELLDAARTRQRRADSADVATTTRAFLRVEVRLLRDLAAKLRRGDL